MKKFLFTFALILVTPCLAFAQQKYQPLINIPGVTDAGDGTFAGYINFLYAFSIGIAGLLAVIKIIVAGVKYMMTDVVSTKSNAKGEITGALLGLLLILGAYIILNTINPRLNKQETNFDALPPDPALVERPSVKVDSTGQVTVDPTECTTHTPVSVVSPSSYPWLVKGPYTKLDPATCSQVSTPNDYCKNNAQPSDAIVMGEGAVIPAQSTGEAFAACMSYVKENMVRYCIKNSGRFGQQTKGAVIAYACQLPEKNLGASQLGAEFATYKQTILDKPVTGSVAEQSALLDLKKSIGSLTSPNTVAMFKEVCGIKATKAGGVWLAKDSPKLDGGQKYSPTNDVNNYRCVQY